jgi:hypothetical protein
MLQFLDKTGIDSNCTTINASPNYLNPALETISELGPSCSDRCIVTVSHSQHSLPNSQAGIYSELYHFEVLNVSITVEFV